MELKLSGINRTLNLLEKKWKKKRMAMNASVDVPTTNSLVSIEKLNKI